MSPDPSTDPKLTGIVEVDETYIGGKPRVRGTSKSGRGTSKTPVFAAVQRNGRIQRRVVPDVTADTLHSAMREMIDKRARIMSDEYSVYDRIGREFMTHDTIRHRSKQYARGNVHVNTAESSFALIKRGIHGIYHNVSREYLHRYLWQFDFLWNTRKLNDGERTILAIQSAEGKRMMYRANEEE